MNTVIGVGHSGKVVSATNLATGEECALKIIPAKVLKEPKQFEHMLNEKHILSKISNHPSFPKLMGTFSEEV